MSEDLATQVNMRIVLVSKLVESFRDKVRADEINNLDQAEAFLNAWLEGMQSLAE